jgi:hypothetical protein
VSIYYLKDGISDESIKEYVVYSGNDWYEEPGTSDFIYDVPENINKILIKIYGEYPYSSTEYVD